MKFCTYFQMSSLLKSHLILWECHMARHIFFFFRQIKKVRFYLPASNFRPFFWSTDPCSAALLPLLPHLPCVWVAYEGFCFCLPPAAGVQCISPAGVHILSPSSCRGAHLVSLLLQGCISCLPPPAGVHILSPSYCRGAYLASLLLQGCTSPGNVHHCLLPFRAIDGACTKYSSRQRV